MQGSQNVQPNQLFEDIARAFQFYNGNDTVQLYVCEDEVNSRIESLNRTGIQVVPLPIRQRPAPAPHNLAPLDPSAVPWRSGPASRDKGFSSAPHAQYPGPTRQPNFASQRPDGPILHAAYLIQVLRRKQLVKRSRDQLHMKTPSGKAIDSLQNFCADHRERKPSRLEYLQFVVVMVTDGLRLYLLLDMALTTFQALGALAEKLPASETRNLEFDDYKGQIYSEYWYLFEDPKVFELDGTTLQEKLKEGEKITHALNGKLGQCMERLQAEIKELEDAKAISMKNSQKGSLGSGVKGKGKHNGKIIQKTEGSKETKEDKPGGKGESIVAEKEEKNDEGVGEEDEIVQDFKAEGRSGKKEEKKVENVGEIQEKGENSKAKKEEKKVESVEGVAKAMEDRKDAEAGKGGKECESAGAVVEEQTEKGKNKETAASPESKENPGEAPSGGTGKKQKTKEQMEGVVVGNRNGKGGGSSGVPWTSGGGKNRKRSSGKRKSRKG